MKLSPDFEKFLSFIPEILSRDESFLKDLESCTRGVTIRKGGLFDSYGRVCAKMPILLIKGFLSINILMRMGIIVTGFSSDSMYPFVSTIGYFTQVPSEFEVKAIEDGELLCFPGRISNVCVGISSFRYLLSECDADDYFQALFNVRCPSNL